MAFLLSQNDTAERYEAGLAALRKQFESSGHGAAMVRGRSSLVDEVIQHCFHQLVSQGTPADCVAIVPLGGYGRGTLLPHSDVDLLFLFRDLRQEAAYKDALSRIYLDLWDLKVRASATARTVSECGKLDPENPEFTVSLLDSRFLTGDPELFKQVRGRVLPALLRKSGQQLIELVSESARTRHAKFANTIYHLEPNVKEGPGGLRDYNLTSWLALVNRFSRTGIWPDAESLFEERLRKELDSAFDFLISVRCFLHYQNGRDDNLLNWEAQDASARRGVGIEGDRLEPSQWMREYFRNSRAIYGASLQLLQEVPVRKPSLRQRWSNRRSRRAAAGFSVVDERVVLPSDFPVANLSATLEVFRQLSVAPLRLSIESQRIMTEAAPSLATGEDQRAFWPELRPILLSRHAGNALRAMRDCGLLDALVPEFKLIDALAVRDFFHRYTVDEHSFLCIETLHTLKESSSEWPQRFAEILGELERPELLFLSLFLHDMGKGSDDENHVSASLQIARQILDRWRLEQTERDAVRFLIQNHLEMSAAMRRDIFDPGVIAAMAARIGTPETLKMLTLLTYADISSVNPEAMTDWKAENLWQLYAATSNFLNRHADEDKVRGTLDKQTREKFAALPRKLIGEIEPFLEGLPHRYLSIYSTDQIVRHYELASRLWQERVQTTLVPYRDLYEFTVVTKDKPFLFATLAGALAAWGMEIVKANAFSNSNGVVVDSFQFKDRFRTLDLNPSEHERLKKSVAEVVRGDRSLEQLIRARSGFKRSTPVRVQVKTRIIFDDESSANSTLLEVVAQDRPGLLYRLAETLAEMKCNIDIALIDTEGEMALDVFYLTSGGRKLTLGVQESIRSALMGQLNSSS
jgi:[protein-PII] uridylyltransferase